MTPTEYTARKMAFHDVMLRDRDLSPLVKVVGALLLSHVNSNMGYAWPSIHRLANEANCSERSAQYAVRALVKLGWFVIVPGSGGGRGMANRYVPCLDLGDTTPKKGAKASSNIEHERVQIPAERVQNTVSKGCSGLHPNPYIESNTRILETQTAEAEHGSVMTRVDVVPPPKQGTRAPSATARATIGIARQGENADPTVSAYRAEPGRQQRQLRKLVTSVYVEGKQQFERDLHSEIVELMKSELRVAVGDSWRLLMELPSMTLEDLARRQRSKTLTADDLAMAISEVTTGQAPSPMETTSERVGSSPHWSMRVVQTPCVR